MATNRLLIMDDDIGISTVFGEVATGLGFDAQVLNHPATFFERVAAVDPDVLMLDLQMPGYDGIELLRGLGERGCRASIFITSGLDTRVLATAEQLGLTLGLNVVGTISKPIDIDPLRDLLAPFLTETREITAEELANAIEAGQIVVHYLPKVTNRGEGGWVVEGAEALVRWQHERHGLLYPSEFLGLAESSGSMVALTDCVFRLAMEQASAWFARGIYVELGLNLSAGFLSDLEFPDRLLRMIRDHSLDPSMITIELTETSALVDAELALDVLTRMRVKHVNLALDDFGVGKSSLIHLYRMPFSEVKLDNTFIRDMRTSDDARTLVQGLIELAHKLHIQACAEGVEEEAAFRMLESMGCDRIQGHYIGSAVPATEFEALLKTWNERHAGKALSHTA